MRSIFDKIGLNSRKKGKNTSSSMKYEKNKVYAPFKGKVIALTNVPDEVFAQKMLGDGIAIAPEEGKVFSPVLGTVVASFPTGHAFTIKTKTNHAILIHIGHRYS